jgi:NodT family efflux transporter outer membrane factor (OMF) lipoprotein
MKKLIVQFRQPFITLCTLSVAVFCAMLAGCNVGPKYIPPTVTAPSAFKESPAQFKESDGWTVAQPQDAALRGKWWEIYKETGIEFARRSTQYRQPEYPAGLRELYGSASPGARGAVAVFPHGKCRRLLHPLTGFFQRIFRGEHRHNQQPADAVVFFPADVSWEPDLWGKVRNTVRASQYSAQLSAADLENERLTEQASLAEYFFEIRGQDALQKILNETVEVDKKALEVVRASYDTGVGRPDLRCRGADNSGERAIGGNQSRNCASAVRACDGHAHRQAASTFYLPVVPRTSAPPAIPIGLPSQLLERRPDIAAAERNMAAANAQIGVAVAAFYPALTLSATGGVESSAIKNLLEWPSRFWSVGPSISETVYDGGLRRATVNQYKATYNADLAAYRQTVLTAFQQVEDSLAAVRILSQQIRRQQEAVDSSQTFLRLELGRYETGIDPYIDVTIAQTTLLANQQSLATLEVQQMTASVQLIEVLGGGWDRSQLPTPSQVTQKPSKAETAIRH